MQTKDINELDGIDEWIYPLRQFIDIATRYEIKGVFNSVRPGREFSTIFEYYVNVGKNCYDHFKKEFEKQLTESTNPKYVLVRVRNEFLPMIQQYKEWFERNKKDTEIFEPYNPYRYMLDLMISTEAEIGSYVKSIKSTSLRNDSLPPLPHCFLDQTYFYNTLLIDPRIKEYYEIHENGSYQWIESKSLLGGLAVRLYDRGKIDKDVIKTNQDLARVFCPFFNISFNEKQEKQFQPDRAQTYKFSFIQ